MGLNDAGRIIDVIREAVKRETKSGARIEYSYGQVATSTGNSVSAYLNGNYDSASDGFRVPAHLHVNVGDYGHFAVDHGRGSRWLVEILPNTLYSKIAIDPNEGILYVGDGNSPPAAPLGNKVLIWDGAEFVYDNDGPEDEFLWE